LIKKDLKPKKCKNKLCGVLFTPRNSMQSVCSPLCALAYTQQKKEKKEKAQIRKAKNELLKDDRSHWLKNAQREFNKFIRLRDHHECCISCPKTNGKFDAGHFRTVGAAPQHRFNEDNVHKQCSWYCNKNQSGNIVEYRINLVKKIGLDRVEKIENDNKPKNYTLEEIKYIYQFYRLASKLLQGRIDNGEDNCFTDEDRKDVENMARKLL